MKKRLLTLLLLGGLLLFGTGCDAVQVLGTDGQAHSINIASDGQFVVNTEGVFQEIAMHGELEQKTALSFHLMGRRAGFTSTTALQDLKEFDATTTALFPTDLTGGETLQIISSSANDTSGGTGARQVRISYLDINDSLAQYDASTNGTTAVTLPFAAHFVYAMEVTIVGSNEVAVGNILLRTTPGNVTYEQITAGGNRSLSSHFQVPAGYTGYLVSWEADAITTAGGAQQQDVRLRATVNRDGTLSTAYHFIDNMFLSSGTASPQVQLPFISLPALTKIKVSTLSTSTATTTRADASYCIFIVHN